MKHITFKPDACCEKPLICTMDYPKPLKTKTGAWAETMTMVNRVCTKCWTHWFGAPGKVKRYARAEWDAYISETA